MNLCFVLFLFLTATKDYKKRGSLYGFRKCYNHSFRIRPMNDDMYISIDKFNQYVKYRFYLIYVDISIIIHIFYFSSQTERK